MKLLITADLHYNHRRSRPLADELIQQMNRTGGDLLLVVGDTATSESDALEQCLGRFDFQGPRLFVSGNHELWTTGGDSHLLLRDDLPRRVRAMGWHWLQGDPCILGGVGLVGNIGWYDYSFAQPELGIPLRFYAHKVSPGAAARVDQFAHLLERTDDIPPHAREIVARWNDGRYVKLHRSDEQFLDELLTELQQDLEALRQVRTVIAAIHHLPFPQLLPPSHTAQWDFAKAYLGSAKIGDLLLQYPNLHHLYCGHSHFPAQAQIAHIQAINIGSGYRRKRFLTLTLEA
jgi:predicted phosphodiesterase